MNLPNPPLAYDRTDQAKTRELIRRADGDNLKRGRDIELGAGRLILTDRVTGARYSLTIASGAVSLDVV